MTILILTRAQKVGKADIDLFSKYFSNVFYVAGTYRRELVRNFTAKKRKETRKK